MTTYHPDTFHPHHDELVCFLCKDDVPASFKFVLVEDDGEVWVARICESCDPREQ